MIFVEELDIYLRAFFYWINFGYYQKIFQLSDNVKAWKRFLNMNQRPFKEIEDSAEKFGFLHEVAWAVGMSGEKEIKTRRMNLFLSFEGLKIYPRLLYSEGYLPKPKDFQAHKYYFTYLPKVLMPVFKKVKAKWEISLTTYWTIGSHRYLQSKNEHRIAYNVSVQVNLATIVEEELHALGERVHGTAKREDILTAIKKGDPNLQRQIELNLNHILSAEEKKFRDFGGLISEERAPDLRKLETFCSLFENALIEKAS